jgi:hypothetical protein
VKPFENWTELSKVWKELCQAQYDAKNRDGLSIGLELEFFLLDSNQSPVGLESSQAFLHSLLTLYQSRGHVNIEEEILNGKKCLSRIKCPIGSTAWNSIGYEYPPHMLEVSLSYHPSLVTLKAELKSFLEDASRCAEALGLTICLQASLNEKQQSEMQRIENSTQRVLRQSRLEMLESGPFASEHKVADFPAYLAATHFHIGGYQWWNIPGFVENLYRLEPFVMLEAKGIGFKERWSNYLKVFHNFSLVGFPSTNSWTHDWWMEELFKTSYQRQQGSIDSAYALNKLRDLQVIRPRAIGTIEFRSDAAQSSCDEVMRLAALRLGQFLIAQKKLPDWIPSYAVSQKLWKLQMDIGKDLNEDLKSLVLSEIESQITQRGLGEEVLFLPKRIEKIA